MSSKKKSTYFAGMIILVLLVGYFGIWQWMICRVYVPEGQSLVLTYRGNLLIGNPPTAKGSFAKVDKEGNPLERGILADLRGPGRHFIDPIHYKYDFVNDVVIPTGHVGVVTSKMGQNLPDGEILVGGEVGSAEYRGVMRKMLTPGRYRINPFGYEVKVKDTFGKTVSENTTARVRTPSMPKVVVKKSPQAKIDFRRKQAGWVMVPPGYVGVVTQLATDPAAGIHQGVLPEVLQPGLYVINQYERQVDIVEIGFRETSVRADLARDANGNLQVDDNGEPLLKPGGDPGINFNSTDGYPIHLDFTAVWGITPDQAYKVVSTLGQTFDVERKIILPQINSKARINGSKLKADQLLVGKSREQFQTEVSELFQQALEEENVSLQVGLVRHIYIPGNIREPKQKAKIAEEMNLTNIEEEKTARVEQELRNATESVKLEQERVQAESEKLYQESLALGQKKVEEIRADMEKEVAKIELGTAKAEAEALVLLGGAEAKVEQLKQEALANKFELSIKAFGSPTSYNQWVFASNLPSKMKLSLFYAGEGTFWTDLKGFQETMMSKLVDGPKTVAPKFPPRKVPTRGLNR